MTRPINHVSDGGCRSARGAGAGHVRRYDGVNRIRQSRQAARVGGDECNPLRCAALPDVPIMADFVPGLAASFWTGVGAPKNTPVEIINKLNIEINAALADPVMKARFADLGATTPEPRPDIALARD
jgi:Tripartite tricarboxylate transporter family receptor